MASLEKPLNDSNLHDTLLKIKLTAGKVTFPVFELSRWGSKSGATPAKAKRAHDKSMKELRELIVAALEKFPESTQLHCQACLIVQALKEETSWCDRIMLQARGAVGSLSFKSAFLVHRVQSMLNAGNKQRSEMLSAMQITKQLQAATNQVNLAIFQQLQLWRHLLQTSISDRRYDLGKIAAMCWQIARSIESAQQLLDNLALATGGMNVAVLRQQVLKTLRLSFRFLIMIIGTFLYSCSVRYSNRDKADGKGRNYRDSHEGDPSRNRCRRD